MKKVQLIPAVFVLILLFGCSNNKTIVKGEMSVLTDPSFYHLISEEAQVFSHFYPEALLNIQTCEQEKSLQQFLSGKAEVVVVSRELRKEETEMLSSQNIFPEIAPFAYDALVFVASEKNQKEFLATEEIKNILENDFPGGEGKGSENFILLPHAQSSLASFLWNYFSLKKMAIHTSGSEEKVLNDVKNNPLAIGMVSLSCLYKNENLLKGLRVLGIRNASGQLSFPTQAELAADTYPLKRTVYLVTRYKRGLGTGFASYVLSDEGQRIILKAGLLPVNMPGREVVIKKEF